MQSGLCVNLSDDIVENKCQSENEFRKLKVNMITIKCDDEDTTIRI